MAKKLTEKQKADLAKAFEKTRLDAINHLALCKQHLKLVQEQSRLIKALAKDIFSPFVVSTSVGEELSDFLERHVQ